MEARLPTEAARQRQSRYRRKTTFLWHRATPSRRLLCWAVDRCARAGDPPAASSDSRALRFRKCRRRNRARNWLPGWVIVGCGNDVQLSRHPAHALVRMIIRASKRRSTRLTRAPGSRRRHPRNKSLIAPARMASRDTREIRPRSPPVLGTHRPDYSYDRCGQRSDTEVKVVGFKERPWPRKSHFLLATFPGGRPPTSIVQHHSAAV